MRMLPFFRSLIKSKLQPKPEMTPGVWSHHYFRDFEHYALEGFFYDTDTLVISFEHAAADNKSDAYRPGWGALRFRRQNVSHLCIKPKAGHWYLEPGLVEAFTELRASGLFEQYSRRITYGGSMGGFGALVFADLVEATTVLSLNPQTTLNRKKVPWEKRFGEARTQDWNGPWADAIGKSNTARDVIVVYDPFEGRDNKHIYRLDQPNLVHIRAPFLGHGIGAPLGKLRILGPMLTDVIRDRLDLKALQVKLRSRRTIDRYYDQLLQKKRVRKSPLFKRIVEDARRRNT